MTTTTPIGAIAANVGGGAVQVADQAPQAVKKKTNPYQKIHWEWKGYTRKNGFPIIGTTYCRTWTKSEAIRELFQNAIDNMLKLHKETHGECSCWVTAQQPPKRWQGDRSFTQDFCIINENGRMGRRCGFFTWEPQGPKNPHGPLFTIVNFNSRFGPTALTPGCSSKPGTNAAGRHGEGLKSASAVALRTGLELEVYQSGIGIRFSADRERIWYHCSIPGSAALKYAKRTKRLIRNSVATPEKDVIVRLGGHALTFEDVRSAASRFLSLTHRRVRDVSQLDQKVGVYPPVVVKRAAERSLLFGKRFAGRVYVHGILFEVRKVAQKRYGVDLHTDDASDRDRRTLSDEEYQSAIGEVVSSWLDVDATFADELLKEFDDLAKDPHAVDHLRGLAGSISETAKRIVIEAYKNRPENVDVAYIVPGFSDRNLSSNDIVPRWCDVGACRVVHPALYSILSDGFPAVATIQDECTERLLACEQAPEDDTTAIREWILEKEDLFQLRDNLHLEQGYIDQIELLDSEEKKDVPLFVVKKPELETDSDADSVKRLGSIVFSTRAFAIFTESKRDFLALVCSAFQEVYDNYDQPEIQQLSPQSPEMDPPSPQEPLPQEITIPETPPPVALPANPLVPLPSDFSSQLHIAAADTALQDSSEQVQKLLNSLSDEVTYEGLSLRCTPEARTEWEEVEQTNPEAIQTLANTSISFCRSACQVLTNENLHLGFFVAPHSRVRGYYGKDGSIHVNLRSVLLEASLGNTPAYCSITSHFAHVMSHEFAHHQADDGHSVAHGNRTATNFQKLWSKMPDAFLEQ